MRKFTFILALLITITGSAIGGEIDSGLNKIMQGAETDQVISTLVFLEDQVDLDGITDRMDAQRATLR
ncbi:MAG: hypothetical protein GF307_03340, partial [candidate division Zixibacteria bacterium]|nr:hypothetical protein [candidate division Zixibacteria bacterium]